jgi:hypothetical protein
LVSAATGTMSLKGALEELGFPTCHMIDLIMGENRELDVDGWEPICEKLGVPVPDKPFPHLHDTNEFRTGFGLEPIPA